MRHKYHAKPTVYDGIRYDSKREAQYAGWLDMMRAARKKRDRVVAWERQVRFGLYAMYGHWIADLVLDFRVEFADGREEFHEIKGVETPVWKLKFKWFKALYPDLTVRIIK